MNVAIVVPRRPHWHRDRLWAFCKPRWDLGWPMYEVEHTEGLFNRSWCANEGARRAGDFDVLLLIDSDVFVDHDIVREAVHRAFTTGRYTVAGNERVALAQYSTGRVLNGYPERLWNSLRIELCAVPGHRGVCKVSNHNYNSHAIAIRRDLWDEVGGFDERFEGWGHEDGAFLTACETWVPGVERVPGRLVHLWHERAPERYRIHPHWGKNRDLRRRYTEARGDREAMRMLLKERFE